MSTSDERLPHDQERKLVELGRRIFAESFPNPTREGCPPQQVLKAMALRQRQLPITKAPVDHLTICSPCFQDYSRYRRQARQRTFFSRVLAAATILAIGAGLWIGGVLPGSSSRPAGGANVAPAPPLQQDQPILDAELDLRRWSPIRGKHTQSENNADLRLPRKRVRIAVLLPVGSEEGAYELLLSRSGNVVATSRSEARLSDGVTLLQAQMDLTQAAAGRYTLRIQHVGSISRDYPVKLE